MLTRHDRAPHPTHPVTRAPRNSSIAHSNMSDVDVVFFTRKLLKSFILLYKSLPCLWDRECTSYKIKQKRNDALNKLTSLVQKYEPNATRLHVVRKIDSLRTCVRREYKKVVESRRTATSEDEVYTPQLWYYKLLSFIFTDEENELNSFNVKELPDSPEQSALWHRIAVSELINGAFCQGQRAHFEVICDVNIRLYTCLRQ